MFEEYVDDNKYEEFNIHSHLLNVVTQLSMKFIHLINVKTPTSVGILTFISMINTTSERFKASNFFICRYLSFY